MTEPYLGQITLYACNFAPRNWALCQGQLLPISEYTALFSLLGTYYGGNGTTTFALPDLRSRTALGQGLLSGGQEYDLGESGGVETVNLVSNEMPLHNHSFYATTASANTVTSNGAQLGVGQAGNPAKGLSKANVYSPGVVTTTLNPQSLAPYGTPGPHNNLQPYLALNYCIALTGIYPPRS